MTMKTSLRDFRIGWRLLVKEPAYSAVVVFGLAVGIAVCFLLLGFVRHSFSYDENVPERERVMRLMQHWNVEAIGTGWSDGVSLPARDAALASGQPLLASAVSGVSFDVRAGDIVGTLGVALVDPDFEKIFAPKVLAGDLHAALTRPDAVALTRDAAIKMFGRADVVGKTLQNDRQTYLVAAVVADQPAATTLPYEALAGSGGTVWPSIKNFRNTWGGTAGRVYLKLLPDADPQAVLEAVRRGLRASSLVQRDYAEQVAALGGRDLIEYKLGPIADAYLDPDTTDHSPIHGERQAMLGLAVVALLILLLAATNYVNLATIRTLARQREIAMRKVLGASAPAVARQFLAESVLVCLIATVLGLLLAWLVLPLFADLVQRRFDTMFSPGAIAGALAFGVLLGVAAGAWPTWSALRVRASAALAGRNGTETARGLWLRRSLTALQFAVAMGLTGTTLAVAWQTHYASTLSPGFDPRPLLTLPAGNDMRDPRLRAFRDEVLRLPGVANVAESSTPVTFTNAYTTLRREGGQATDVNQYSVSPEFFDVYGLKPVAGRLYSAALDRMNQTDRVVINASAARKFGFASPHDAVGKVIQGTDNEDRQMQVVGVAPDIRHRSAREGAQPSVFYLRDRVRILTIRCSGDPVAVKHAIEEIWPRHFPNEPVSVVHMDSFIVEEFYADDLRLAKLLAASSVIAMAIAAFGIYVLAAYSVQRREREIVLRKLYGANGMAVGGLVLREFALLVGAGAVAGLPFAWVAMQRYLASFAERAPIGAWTIVAALLLACAVTLGSTLRHTLAAVRIRPALALRE
ncbi:Macrolide export ATP-binding/permease protein MacB [Massilia sp. Bi118]|uniref:ABC transporter permease n=1 Tax=Massilia sp. Bi118 TaxID=2822346 RepID=UPI001E051105|nr:ABC transporter permease [Massilia sp. Bi118]CAH0220137.1 Macrolide export ATP-binding/permease protein MacB [Massilia sp. Bi118]